MCTLMQKDVLIELVAYVQGMIARKANYSLKNTPDTDRLVDLRQFLYKTSPEEIDFKLVCDECNAIKAKYESQPETRMIA